MKSIRTTAIFIGVITLLAQGCNSLKKNQPSNEQIKAAIAAEAPPYMTVVDVTPEFLPGASDKQWLINVKVTVAPKEDLLSFPDQADVAEINDLIHQNNALLSWNADFERVHQEGGLPKVKMDTLKVPQLLEVKQQKQAGVSIYGKMSAEYQVDRWKMSVQLDFPDQGKPISAYRGAASDYTIKGTPAADEFIRNLHKAVESNTTKKMEMIAKVESIAKEAAEKLEAMKKAQRDALMAATSPGLRYVGVFSSPNKTEKVTIDFEKNEMNGSLLEFKLSSATDSNQWLLFRGRIDIDQQGMFYISAKYVDYRVADKDNRQLKDFTAWWYSNYNGYFINECKSVQINKNHLIMELNGATINADRVEKR